LLQNRLSDNVGAVNHFLSVLRRALRRARHFALVEAFAFAFALAFAFAFAFALAVALAPPTKARS
jgi:small neutral amino acid transporter SnatA (MarC family)